MPTAVGCTNPAINALGPSFVGESNISFPEDGPGRGSGGFPSAVPSVGPRRAPVELHPQPVNDLPVRDGAPADVRVVRRRDDLAPHVRRGAREQHGEVHRVELEPQVPGRVEEEEGREGERPRGPEPRRLRGAVGGVRSARAQPGQGGLAELGAEDGARGVLEERDGGDRALVAAERRLDVNPPERTRRTARMALEAQA